jgi:uncharacterized surface protein with fasciclin (FAS1) repeats
MFTFDGSATADPNCTPNVLEVAAQNPDLTLSSTLLDRVDLTDIFSCPGPFTALLPTNAAWDAVDPAFLEYLLRPENEEELEDVLLYHILGGSYPSSVLFPGPLDTLLSGEQVDVTVNPVMFDDAGLEIPDIAACNGIIHGIRTVLLPFGTRKFLNEVLDRREAIPRILTQQCNLPLCPLQRQVHPFNLQSCRQSCRQS